MKRPNSSQIETAAAYLKASQSKAAHLVANWLEEQNEQREIARLCRKISRRTNHKAAQTLILSAS